MKLRQKGKEVSLVFSKDPEKNVTDQLLEYSEQKMNKLVHFDDFIFKKTLLGVVHPECLSS